MIKRTILLGKPIYVSLKLSQLKLEATNGEITTTPIEDLGAVIVDHPG